MAMPDGQSNLSAVGSINPMHGQHARGKANPEKHNRHGQFVEQGLARQKLAAKSCHCATLSASGQAAVDRRALGIYIFVNSPPLYVPRDFACRPF